MYVLSVSYSNVKRVLRSSIIYTDIVDIELDRVGVITKVGDIASSILAWKKVCYFNDFKLNV